jgi:hypothetical protein
MPPTGVALTTPGGLAYAARTDSREEEAPLPRRTYIYYSERKVLELKDDVPPSRWKRAASRVAGVGVTVFGTGAKIDLGPPEREPILRTMQNLWMDLGEEGEIGTFDEPKRYFYGTLVFYHDVYDTVDPPVFFLVGATDRTIVGLGGSPDHVRGFRGRQIRAAHGAPRVVMEPDVADVIYRAELAPAEQEEITPAGPGQDIRAIHLAKMYESWRSWKGKKMEFEVLAVKEGPLLHASPPHTEAQWQVLFGSPIFVALPSETAG